MLVAVLALTGCAARPADEQQLRAALAQGGDIVLPAGVTTISEPLVVAEGASDVHLRGASSGSTIALADSFSGKAAIVARGGTGLRMSDFAIEGNRGTPEPTQVYLAPSDVSFADHYSGNGILVSVATGAAIERVRISGITGFAILIHASHDVQIDHVEVRDSGSLNTLGRNNTTGGILIEEGSTDFSVTASTFEHIAGSAIWTHSNYTSPRNADGSISGNTITEVGRDAIQVGHATRVDVSENKGSRIGYPMEWVDLEGQGVPVAVDTAGNVDDTYYVDNRFTDVNGRCFDLDGFHDGVITRNACVNDREASEYPLATFGVIFNNANIDMTSKNIELSDNLFQGFSFGGAYVIGSGHKIIGNRFLDINRAKCTTDVTAPGCHYAPDQPGALSTGIYLSTISERPAVTRDNEIRDNTIVGFGMSKWCIGAGGGAVLSENVVAGNVCEENEQPEPK